MQEFRRIHAGDQHAMVFRNPQKDMFTLEMYDSEGKTRVLLKHQSATDCNCLYSTITDPGLASISIFSFSRSEPLIVRGVSGS